jgi:hypothetical protein
VLARFAGDLVREIVKTWNSLIFFQFTNSMEVYSEPKVIWSGVGILGAVCRFVGIIFGFFLCFRIWDRIATWGKGPDSEARN